MSSTHFEMRSMPFLLYRGYYADIPFVSESVYHQVRACLAACNDAACVREQRQALGSANGRSALALLTLLASNCFWLAGPAV